MYIQSATFKLRRSRSEGLCDGRTPFQAIVNRPQDFVCRAGFASRMKIERNGGLYVFTYAGDGSAPAEDVHLRSEHGAVVIDTAQSRLV